MVGHKAVDEQVLRSGEVYIEPAFFVVLDLAVFLQDLQQHLFPEPGFRVVPAVAIVGVEQTVEMTLGFLLDQQGPLVQLCLNRLDVDPVCTRKPLGT